MASLVGAWNHPASLAPILATAGYSGGGSAISWPLTSTHGQTELTIGGADGSKHASVARRNEACGARKGDRCGGSGSKHEVPDFHYGESVPSTFHAWTDRGLLTERGLGHVLECVAAMKEALGDGVGLALDCGPGWTLPDAIRFARAVEKHNLMWLEDMLTGDYIPYVNADVYADVTRATSTRRWSPRPRRITSGRTSRARCWRGAAICVATTRSPTPHAPSTRRGRRTGAAIRHAEPGRLVQMLHTEVDGRALAYERVGVGPALVLLHGFAQDSRVWRP
jgi:Enolase C-terminal domain-like